MSGTSGPAAGCPLVVDLDHTLVRTDLLHECVLAAVRSRPAALVAAVRALAAGRSAVKAALVDHVQIDIARLPYHDDVWQMLEQAHHAGRPLALVSAADHRLVMAVADHLRDRGLPMDTAEGSAPGRNLKGAAKADWLVQRFGERGFDYAGDSRADLAVWAHARRIITVGAAPRLRRRATNLAQPDGPAPLHLGQQPGARRRAWRDVLRPRQWIAELTLAGVAVASALPATDVLSLVAGFLLGGWGARLAGGVWSAPVLRDAPAPGNGFASGALALQHGALGAVVALAAGAWLITMLGTPSVAVLWGVHAWLCGCSPALTGRRPRLAGLVGLGRVAVCVLAGLVA